MIDQKAVEYENKLIESCQSGKQSSFKELYENYKQALFVICLRYSSSKEEAEDMLQDSFLKIFKEINSFDRSKGSFYTWASRITINTNLEQIRRNKMKIEDLETVINSSELRDTFDVISSMQLAEIIKEIQKMPVGYRTVFNLYFIEGYNHKEIGQLLGVTESTSKTQLMKSKSYFKNTIINHIEVTN